MILYAAQKYIINSFVFFVGLIIIPLFYFEDTSNLFAQTIFFGGLFGGIYTFYDFRQRQLWPLYDNLLIPKYVLLLAFFLLLQIISIVINILF